MTDSIPQATQISVPEAIPDDLPPRLPEVGDVFSSLDEVKKLVQTTSLASGFRVATKRTTKVPKGDEKYISFACVGAGGSRHTSTCKFTITFKGSNEKGWKVTGVKGDHDHELTPGSPPSRRGSGLNSQTHLRVVKGRTASMSNESDAQMVDTMMGEPFDPIDPGLKAPSLAAILQESRANNANRRNGNLDRSSNSIESWLREDFQPFPLSRYTEMFKKEGIHSPYQLLTLDEKSLSSYLDELGVITGFDKKRISTKVEEVRSGSQQSFTFSSASSNNANPLSSLSNPIPTSSLHSNDIPIPSLDSTLAEASIRKKSKPNSGIGGANGSPDNAPGTTNGNEFWNNP